MNEEQDDQERCDQAEPDERPGRPARLGVHVEEHQPGQREQHAGNGEDVDEPAPGAAGVAALVEIIRPADPAAVGQFTADRAASCVDADPGIPTGTGQGDIDFAVRPFGGLIAGVEVKPIVDEGCDGSGQGGIGTGRSGEARLGSRAEGSCADSVLVVGEALIVAAWFRVNPVAAKSSMPISETAALIQCQL